MPPIDSAYQLLTKLLSPKRHAALTIQKKTDFIQSCVDAGDVLVRVGADLVRLKANGEMETVEGFFDQAGLVDDYALTHEQVLRWRGALGLVISGGVEVAQAQTPSASTAVSSDAGTSDAAAPSLESTVVAKVAGISGSAQVIRQGVLTTLSVGDPIYLGDIISSQANAKVNLNVVKADAANSVGPGVTIGESTRMMVTGQFVTAEQSNNKVFELSLKVDAGAVAVDPHPRTDLSIQVQVPQGQIQVPTNGINVKVENQTGQTAVNLPSTADGNAAAVASVAIVGANGQVSQLQVGQAAQALAANQALSADCRKLGPQDVCRVRIGGKDVEGSYVVSGPVIAPEQLPDSHPSKKLALDFVNQYEKAYGAGSRNQFAGHTYDALIVLEKAVPMALKKAKAGTPEFRAALRDAIETMGRTNFAHGIMNWTKDDHWGYTNETGVIVKVVNGDWKVE